MKIIPEVRTARPGSSEFKAAVQNILGPGLDVIETQTEGNPAPTSPSDGPAERSEDGKVVPFRRSGDGQVQTPDMDGDIR